MSHRFRGPHSFAPTPSGIPTVHCAGLGAGSEMVVLVFEVPLRFSKVERSEINAGWGVSPACEAQR
jgi:hypothetical protein